MKHLLLTFALSILTLALHGQNISEGGYGKVKTNLSIDYEHSRGQISDEFEARASYECIKNRWLTLSANAKYNSYTVDFDDDALSDGLDPEVIGLNRIHVMGQLGVTATARTKMFGKPVMGLAMINGDFSSAGFDRLSGIVMGLVMLKATRNTQFGIGPWVMINSTSKLPAFLVFMYRHRFNEKWIVNLYGGMFGVDYCPTKNDLLAIGADIDVKSLYFNPKVDNLPKGCRLTLTSFRPLLKYRRRLVDNLYFEAKGGGVSLKMSCRGNGRTGSHEYFECSQKAAPFGQLSVSDSL